MHMVNTSVNFLSLCVWFCKQNTFSLHGMNSAKSFEWCFSVPWTVKDFFALKDWRPVCFWLHWHLVSENAVLCSWVVHKIQSLVWSALLFVENQCNLTFNCLLLHMISAVLPFSFFLTILGRFFTQLLNTDFGRLFSVSLSGLCVTRDMHNPRTEICPSVEFYTS
jgi:hypothetical protein